MQVGVIDQLHKNAIQIIEKNWIIISLYLAGAEYSGTVYEMLEQTNGC